MSFYKQYKKTSFEGLYTVNEQNNGYKKINDKWDFFFFIDLKKVLLLNFYFTFYFEFCWHNIFKHCDRKECLFFLLSLIIQSD